MTVGRTCAVAKPEELITKLSCGRSLVLTSPIQSLADAIRQIDVSEVQQHGGLDAAAGRSP